MADQEQQQRAQPTLAPAAGVPGEGRREGESQHAVDPMQNDPVTVSWAGGRAFEATEGALRGTGRRPVGGCVAAPPPRPLAALPPQPVLFLGSPPHLFPPPPPRSLPSQRMGEMRQAAGEAVKEGISLPTPGNINELVYGKKD